MTDFETELDIAELRSRFLPFTRAAFGMLPPLNEPRILDIGCGSGIPTLELAKLCACEIVGIDIDEAALAKARQRIAEGGLSDRVEIVITTLQDAPFPNDSFDLLWEEGVLHLLDPSESFARCQQLLKPEGHLVMLETRTWFAAQRDLFPAHGFELIGQHLLPEDFWITDYFIPLQARVDAVRAAHPPGAEIPGLARYEQELEWVRANPSQVACGFYLLRKR